MTQHPEMWNAIVIQVPLLDMLRYEQIAAGASWVGEYGFCSGARAAGLSCIDFALQSAQAGCVLSRALDFLLPPRMIA